MSKSKGNVIDPLTVIEEYGTDAFRFTLAAFAAQGRDIKLSMERISGYRHFVNKLWNASRFVLMNLEDFDPTRAVSGLTGLSLADRWILTRLAEAAEEANRALAEYKFNEAAGALYAFTWHRFCDWYIELTKDVLYGEDAEAKERTQTVLYFVLENLLRLLHPFIPFITEEIWQALSGRRPCATIMQAAYPVGKDFPRSGTGAAKMELIMEIIRGIRNIRGEMNVSPSKRVAAVLDCRDAAAEAVVREGEGYIRTLARLESLETGVAVERPKQSATQVAGDVEILVPLAGLIDIEEEERRLHKEIKKIEKDVNMFEKKLANRDFVAKAPAEVLEKNRGKLAEAKDKHQVLKASLEKILALK
jgi:valyl-tRNA synthetase